VHLTDPNDPDSDGDGLDDSEEVSKGTDPNNDQDPKVIDTDKDNLTNFDEIYVHNTDPKKADTDGDSINDDVEIAKGTDPLDANADADGDGFTDAEEIGAVPPTDPNDNTSKPVSLTYGDPHSIPNPRNESQSISITETFAPFGQRPNTDKTSEDGSAAIRDQNGVIIWVDNRGNAVRVPNSSLAKTLYISNTECVVWQNRFDGTFNQNGSKSQVVVHRRTADGALTSSPFITIDGTVLETSSVSPSTYGFTLVASSRFDDGNESRQRYVAGADENGNPRYEVRDVDQWDGLNYTIYRITWDDKLQTLSNRAVNVPKAGNTNLGNTLVLGNGSDGSFFFTNILARDFYDDVDDEDPGVFKSQLASFWVTTTQDKEGIDLVGDWAKPTISAPYVTNTRIILETSVLNVNEQPTGAVKLRDLRIQANGNRFEAASRDLDSGDNVLPVSNYTRDGLPIYIYTINAANTGIKLYRLDTELVRLGGMVTLPAPVVRGNPYVRDPRDASLLIKSEGAGLVWVPAAKNWQTGELIGLARPRLLPNSSKAMPLFVSATEAVGWMNAAAPVDLANGGVVPNAQLTHFAINTSNVLVTKELAPPIVGRYVALTPSLSPDAKAEGWYISTFERESTRVALMRTYRLRTAAGADEDADGLLDVEEDALLTEADNPDTDEDMVSDGREIYPFYLVTGSFTYEQARTEAIRRGGRLAVLDTPEKRAAIERLFGNLSIGTQYWIGGSDMDGPKDIAGAREGQYRWMDETGRFFDDAGNLIPGLANIDVTPASGLFSVGQPNNNGNADGLVLRQDYKWAMAPLTRRYGFIFEYRQSDPKLADSDGDGLSDLEEYDLGTHPKEPDTDGDSISDYLEVRGYKWNGTAFVLNLENAFKSEPRLKDTDGDGLNDDFESKRTQPTYPSLPDTDADGLTDFEEINGFGVGSTTSNPLNSDTDGDGFTDYDELTSMPASNPNDPSSRPQPGQLTPPNSNLHDQVQLVREQSDLTIPQSFSPFGNRTDYNRFGDDGSAILLDVNGVLLWQDATGVARTIPNSEFAIPLMVSGSEAIIWTNALDPQRLLGSDGDSGDSQSIKVAVYRIDSAGKIVVPKTLSIAGQDILPTAPITATREAYTLVTFEHFGNGGLLSPSGTYAYVYRLTFTGDPQLLSVIEIPNTDGYLTAIQKVRAMGHGTDGSVIFSIDANAWFPYNYRSDADRFVGNDPNQDFDDFEEDDFWIDDRLAAHRRIFAVNGSHPGPSGVVEELSAGTRIANLGEGGLPPRALYTSATRVVYQTFENGQIKDARRSPSTGALVSDSNFASPVGVGNYLRATTQSREGDIPWIYATTADGLKLRAYRLTNTGLELAYEASLPTGYSLDSAAIVSKINPLDGSAVISPNNADLLWVFDNNKPGVTNAVRIPNSTNARAAYVERNELVVWGNARAAINNNGTMADVQVRHYEQKDGNIVNPTNAYTDLSAKIDGRYLLDTVPYTPDFSQWVLNTVEKISPTTARIRSYLLVRYKDLDTDADGIPDIIEVQAAVGTSPFNKDTDGDTLLDGDELYPYAIIEGSFTWDEAKADAIKRGGSLAVIQNRDDYTAVRNRYKSNLTYDLWLGASDKATEGTWVWENGIQLNTTKWLEASPFASWEDYYSGASQTRAPWATGKPNDFNNSDGLIIRPDGSFEDRPLATKLAYLIEYDRTQPKTVDGPGDTDSDGISDKDELAFGTDPLKADTDGDGVSDYNEIFVLFTDPNFNPLAPPTSSTPAVAIDYNKAKGTYQGMVLSDANGLTYHLTLSVTAKGAFTGNIQGAFGRLAIKGSLSSTGTADFNVNNLGALSMSMRSLGSTYVISGKLESTSAGDYQFELRRAKTSQSAELLTFTAGLLSESTIHTGAAVATGTVAKNAKVTFQIYNADGTRATYAGSALDSGTGLDRGIISLFARNKQGSLLMGNMILVPNGTTAKNKLFGNLRFSNNGGFDQDREVAGATFVAPTVGTLPLSSFAFESNNMVMRWNDGAFDGHHKVATWLPTSVAVPLTENESASVTYDRKTGLMKAVYTLTDSSLGLNKTPSTAYAVTVDGFDDMIGMYMDSTSSGLFSVAPNSENLPPVGTYNKPKSSSTNGVTLNSAGKDVPQSGAGLTYTVSVVATGDWKVVIPSSVNWLSVSIANKNGTTSPALSGNGDATVTIIAATNQTQKVREAIITIGGVSHKVRQARY
jgi:hypothetical protein